MRRVATGVFVAIALCRALVAAQQPGVNFNVISGNRDQFVGDRFLQRQVEPAVVVSTRNPDHILAAAIDYRMVDQAIDVGVGNNRNAVAKAGAPVAGPAPAASPDAWIGIYRTCNRFQTSYGGLLPGFPGDNSPAGVSSPLRGFTSASDPIGASLPGGQGFIGGMAFDRGGRGVVFVSRFTDRNDREGASCWTHDFTTILDRSAASSDGSFLDKPSMASDINRSSSDPAAPGTLYFAYSVFHGQEKAGAFRTAIMFTRSTDGGVSFSRPVKVNMPSIRNQGTTIAVNPLDGRVYLFFRMFSPDNIGYVVSTDFGQSFSRVATVFPQNSYVPFDQPTIDSPYEAFRTNAYPTAAVDGFGRVHVAIAERDASGRPRIVMASSSNHGGSWSARAPVDPRPDKGPQMMPAMVFTAGRLMLSWYEGRLTHPQDTGMVTVPGYPAYTIGITRIFDIRSSMADVSTANAQPAFGASVPVSQYNFYAATGAAVGENYGNLPMFRGGRAPFAGDYIAKTLVRPFVRARPGSNWPHPWKPVLTAEDDPAAAVIDLWGDNRDVVAPTMPASAPSFTEYDPPGSGQLSCRNPGARNANIYGSEVAAVVAGSLQSFKQLGLANANNTMQRTFAVYVQNRSDQDKSFRVSLHPDAGVLASFQQIGAADAIDVTILRYSNITAAVYVRSQNPTGSVRVEVVEIPGIGVNPPAGTQPSANFTINSDPTNPFVENPFVENPGVNASITETHTPFVSNPFVSNPFVSNPGLVDASNKLLANPFVSNPFVSNPFVSNPFVENQAVYDIQDITWQTQNAGSTASAFTALVNIPNGGLLTANGDYQFQLLIYRRQLTAGLQNCDTTTTITDQIISNVPNPFVENPFVENPFVENPFVENPFVSNPFVSNSTFSSAPSDSPGQSARLRAPASRNGLTLVRRTTSPIGADGTTVDEPTSDSVFVTLRVFQMKPDSQVAIQFDATQTPPSLGVFSQAKDVINGIIQPVASSSFAAPNLVPSLAAPPSPPQVSPGGSFTYPNVPIANTGNTSSNSITGSFRSGYYLSADNTFGAGDVLLGTVTTNNAALPAGGTTTAVGPALAIPPATVPGTWHLLMVVDDQANVAESRETDNVAALLIQVLPASLEFVTNPSLGSANQNLAPFKIRVKDSPGAVMPGVTVTVSIGTNAGGGVISGTVTKMTDPVGEATFDDIKLSRGGDGYTFVVTALLAGSPGTTSSPFYVSGFGNGPNNIHGRSGHAATLLADGRVLVTGGSFSSAAAEIYDPATSSWSLTGSLVVNRTKHTATLLNDGRVLIAGGLSMTNNVLSQAEIYDPTTGAFTPLTDVLSSPRTDHRAVLLTNGKVLITGGSSTAPGSPTSLSSSDLFDPPTLDFSATAAMSVSRELHTMTVLDDGSVLVAGGRSCNAGCVFLSTVSVYNAAGTAVVDVAPMVTPRTTQAAAKLGNGTVLIAGGFNFGAMSLSELYSPGSATWASTGAMNAARYAHTATLMEDGSVLVTGGSGVSGSLNSAERYYTSGTWSFTENDMAFSRLVHTATRLASGKVLIVGSAVMTEIYHPYPFFPILMP